MPDFYVEASLSNKSQEACLHYLDSGEHVGSETRHSVLISAEGRWRIVLDQSNGQDLGVAEPEPGYGRALKPSFLVCRPFTRLYACTYVHIKLCAHLNLAFLCVDHYFIHVRTSYAYGLEMTV